MSYSVLLADDDASIRFVLSKSLTKAGFKVRATDNAHTLMKWVKNGLGDVVLSDVHMGREDIFTFIPELSKLRPELPIIIMSANTSVATALKSGNAGVFEYIPKPFDLEILRQTITRALEHKQTDKKNIRPTKLLEPSLLNSAMPMIGKSIAMQPVFRALSDYMSGDIPVIVYGAVGTGKNHAAKLLHEAGKRAQKPFVDFVDLTSVSDGHGGGVVDHILQKVEDGDLFVDRIQELSSTQQALLLRILEKNEERPPAQGFRVISTANISPEALQTEGKVRVDLFYQLFGGELALPPLSQRRGDVGELAHYFLNLHTKKKPRSFNKNAISKLDNYHWPGNVRELKRVMNMISLKYSDQILTPKVLDDVLKPSQADTPEQFGVPLDFEGLRTASRALLHNGPRDTDTKGGDGETMGAMSDKMTPYVEALSWVEKPLIEEALRITAGNNLRAAELLGIHRNTLRTKIKFLNINLDKD